MSALNYSYFNQLNSLGSSPTSVSWFIDRTRDTISDSRYIGNYFVNNSIQFNSLLNIFEPGISTIITTFEIVVDENLEISSEQLECCICMEKKDNTDVCRINCGHTFCIECSKGALLAQLARHETITCSLCRAQIFYINVKNRESEQKFLAH